MDGDVFFGLWALASERVIGCVRWGVQRVRNCAGGEAGGDGFTDTTDTLTSEIFNFFT
jgi:hypothetical protein